MRYIGNIVTKSKVDNPELFNVVDSTEKSIPGIPTLIVGWDAAKELYPDASILESQITEDSVYWTYGRRERRDIHERDVANFKKICRNVLMKNISYVFYNVLSEDRGKYDSIMKWITDSEKRKNIYILNDVAYIYSEGCNKVVGMSLRDIEYIGISKKEFFKELYASENVYIVQSSDTSLSIRSDLRNSAYIIPYLYSDF